MYFCRIKWGYVPRIYVRFMSQNEIDINKQTLVDNFFRRLKNSYGYQDGQLGKNISLCAGINADIAIWRSEKSKLNGLLPDICVVVVCKAEHIRIQAEEYLDAYRNTQLTTANFFVAHNMKETRVFYIDDCHSGTVEQFGDFPKATDIVFDSSLKAFVDKMRECTKDNLIQAFSRCHNIIRNNDKLSPESAFDEISKVIFIKMLYERKPHGELIYSKAKFERDEQQWLNNNKNKDYSAHLFDEVKKLYLDNHLFEKTDILRIKRNSFLLILKELEVIDLYSLAEDVKGVAFESFLGKTFRGELGQFFTPRTIVNYMVDVLDVKEGELVCDPCCGSGGFLIKAFEKVQDDIDRDIRQQMRAIVKSSDSDSEKHRKITTLMLEYEKDRKGSRYYKLCNDYFYGIDANVRMARTSKMNMIMHGDGHVGVYLNDGLLDVGNVKEGMFDVILINPPFGVRLDRSIKVKDDKPILSLFELKSTNAEVLFVERCIRLLKPGGRAGIVLPEGIFNNSSSRKLREYVEAHAHILNITSIPADVFLASGANVKPSLLFIRKFTESERKNAKQLNTKICVSKVDDAGINSLGLPSDNKQLLALAPIVRDWIASGSLKEDDMVRLINRQEMNDWNVLPLFNTKSVRFKTDAPVVKLADIMHQTNNWVTIEDDIEYTRITVKLFNKGIVVRDIVYGSQFKTKKQQLVRAGQFVISKIDGKSGAFAFLPSELDGSIVTPDFPVFDVDEQKVLPEYLELILSNQAILDKIKASCTGSTGRKRLTVSNFLNLQIPLPALTVQEVYVNKILELKRKKILLEQTIASEIAEFNNKIFD